MECVRQSHVSWLMDSGVFSDRYELGEERKGRAEAAVRKMGYELHISSVEFEGEVMTLKVENRGVAPFYYDWAVEMRAGELSKMDWKLSDVLPGEVTIWTAKVAEEGAVAIRVPNPMKGGRDLRFANKGYLEGWLILR